MVDGDGNKRPLPLSRCKDNPSLFSAMQKKKQNKLCGRRQARDEPLFFLSKTSKTIDEFFFFTLLPDFKIYFLNPPFTLEHIKC